MANRLYKEKVELLLTALPEVAKENCFALHGGTAINLFIRDMPRISVDIDLTYLPIEDRETSLKNIASALERIQERLKKILIGGQIVHQENTGKLLISKQKTNIKIEVNLVGRGTLSAPDKVLLCGKAQNEFHAFCSVPIVPHGQLFGGKICAALDRQHPRDLFDVKYLLDNEGFTEAVKEGFLLCLVSGDRPIHETIQPNLQDQRKAMTNQFEGMTEEPFTYQDFENTRNRLLQTIHQNLTDRDKAFLLSVKNVTPAWDIYDFERFPAVQWKLSNLQKLKSANPDKHREQYARLKDILNT